MIITEKIRFTYKTAGAISQRLGRRPGKTYNAEYLSQTGFGNKWQLYDAHQGKTVRMNEESIIYIRDGLPTVLEP